MDIKVATTDRFRKAFRKFNDRDQRIIDAKINSFIAEPTNPGNNYEKLPFIDPKLRSIRVNSDIRIILAEMDGVYFLLYVDSHNKAYSWGNKKRIDRNMKTGAIQIFTDVVEVSDNDLPKVQQNDNAVKKLFDNCDAEQLKIIGVPEGWIDKVLSITSEDEYFKLWQYLPDDAVENLEAIREGFDIRSLVANINAENKETKPVEEQVEDQPGFTFLTDDESLKEILNKDISAFRYYLHPTQKKLVDKNFNGPVKVTGTAGTGKTVAAINRAKMLVENLPDGAKPVFFTTFTKYLIKNIKSMFDDEGVSGNKLIVTNLHNYALELAMKYNLFLNNPEIIFTANEEKRFWKNFCSSYFISDFTHEFLMQEYKDVIMKRHILNEEDYLSVSRTGRNTRLSAEQRKRVWNHLRNFTHYQKANNKYTFDDIIFQLNKYLEQNPDKKLFSHVICDEVQDFSNLELRLLRNMVPEGENDMFLSGDPFQNIYRKQINFSHSGIAVRGRSYRLRINYRTTSEIQQLAFNAIQNEKFEDFNGDITEIKPCQSLIYGEDPKYIVFDYGEDEFEFLAEYVKDNFGTIAMHEMCFAAHTKNKRDELINYFKDKKYPCIKLEDIEDLNETEGKIVFSTLHGLKGLEFKKLVIFDLSAETFPYKYRGYKSMSEEDKKEYLKSEYALLYVSFSRAVSNLLITGTGTPVDWLQKTLES